MTALAERTIECSIVRVEDDGGGGLPYTLDAPRPSVEAYMVSAAQLIGCSSVAAWCFDPAGIVRRLVMHGSFYLLCHAPGRVNGAGALCEYDGFYPLGRRKSSCRARPVRMNPLWRMRCEL